MSYTKIRITFESAKEAHNNCIISCEEYFKIISQLEGEVEIEDKKRLKEQTKTLINKWFDLE